MQRLVHSFGVRGLGCDFCFLSSVVNLRLQFCPSLPAVRDTTTEASRMTYFQGTEFSSASPTASPLVLLSQCGQAGTWQYSFCLAQDIDNLLSSIRPVSVFSLASYKET